MSNASAMLMLPFFVGLDDVLRLFSAVGAVHCCLCPPDFQCCFWHASEQYAALRHRPQYLSEPASAVVALQLLHVPAWLPWTFLLLPCDIVRARSRPYVRVSAQPPPLFDLVGEGHTGPQCEVGHTSSIAHVVAVEALTVMGRL
jgi:hypothetical protein